MLAYVSEIQQLPPSSWGVQFLQILLCLGRVISTKIAPVIKLLNIL